MNLSTIATGVGPSPMGHLLYYWLGPNDGGIKRGDREDTGDNEARPSDGIGPGGSGSYGGERGGSEGHPTGDPSSLGGGPGSSFPNSPGPSGDFGGLGNTGSGGLDDLTILDADDPDLGMTNIGDVPPGDWAADTGPTRSNEEGTGAATGRLNDDSSTL